MKLKGKFQEAAICSLKMPLLYTKLTMSPGGSMLRPQDQGLLVESGQEEAKAHLEDSSEVGKSRQRGAHSCGLGHSMRWTSFVRDCSDLEFTSPLGVQF